MVGRRLSSPEVTMADAVSYLTSVKEAFRNEPEKCREFLKVLNYIKAHRINKDSGIAKMTELIKGHPRLLHGLNVFLPKAKITIPPKAITIPPEANITISTEANKELGQFQYIRVSPELHKLNALSFMASVKEAFHDEPAKHKEWIKILKGFNPRRNDLGKFIARVEKLMKDHRNLLLGFSLFIPPWAKNKITISPEAEKQNAPYSNGTTFMSKLKKRKIEGKKECPSKKRKIKGKKESPPKKKMEHRKRTIHCKKCGQAGHNSRSCGKQARQARGSSGLQMEAS